VLKKIYENLEEAAGVVLLAVMAGFAFLNVITRYFIRYSFASTEEIEVACLVWLTMLGAAAGFRRGVHLGFDLLKIRFPNFGRHVLLPLSFILTIATISFIVWFSIFQIKDEIELKITTEALNIPHWWYTLSMPVGGVLIIFRVIEAAWKSFKEESA
jgi:TRAP-type C4-dicarboxylate transport system permease small subunit